ncbi:hypothetical protein [Pseudoalteromonas luteoviolacea]|uniref:Uncharacterized protein n=1 Tax=Pseudoalteromonas luteoviolacea H33 TaxID=1365251 RepID=A0A167FD71_9GAMM|nr:hypothetical protein [Pseudoalteromonas luteoviolacea]KZN52084.1 hypothetical protein N476_01765 [Pseudoalteromonas luteoviolacea H33]KZN78800.1 hypothetical protein N477_08240 [Pseudoalteromonas luteoviolacea H33-S]MBQ4876164.1 hypothetical protein [Pseudoalteromonas luteoviolacea]MBQ4905799.1 hypothetical protein [Pseudoalteromonas luteoviolacea]
MKLNLKTKKLANLSNKVVTLQLTEKVAGGAAVTGCYFPCKPQTNTGK